LLIFGGKHLENYYNATYIVNLTNYSVSNIPLMSGSLPGAHHKMLSVVYNNFVYMYGGYNMDETISNELWRFNLSSYRWTYVDKLYPFSKSSMIVDKDYLIIVGDCNETSTNLLKIYMFDLINSKFVQTDLTFYGYY
jgi:hypothetical protein